MCVADGGVVLNVNMKGWTETKSIRQRAHSARSPTDDGVVIRTNDARRYHHHRIAHQMTGTDAPLAST